MTDAAPFVKRLLELPENQFCADCHTPHPTWASTTIGVFICLNCSGIHRNLGTHITLVRSVTLDTWTPGQYKIMKKVGNEKGNSYYEHNLSKSFVRPCSSDRPSMERFIYDKYVRKLFADSGLPPSLRNDKKLSGPNRTTQNKDQFMNSKKFARETREETKRSQKNNIHELLGAFGVNLNENKKTSTPSQNHDNQIQLSNQNLHHKNEQTNENNMKSNTINNNNSGTLKFAKKLTQSEEIIEDLNIKKNNNEIEKFSDFLNGKNKIHETQNKDQNQELKNEESQTKNEKPQTKNKESKINNEESKIQSNDDLILIYENESELIETPIPINQKGIPSYDIIEVIGRQEKNKKDFINQKKKAKSSVLSFAKIIPPDKATVLEKEKKEKQRDKLQKNQKEGTKLLFNTLGIKKEGKLEEELSQNADFDFNFETNQEIFYLFPTNNENNENRNTYQTNHPFMRKRSKSPEPVHSAILNPKSIIMSKEENDIQNMTIPKYSSFFNKKYPKFAIHNETNDSNHRNEKPSIVMNTIKTEDEKKNVKKEKKNNRAHKNHEINDILKQMKNKPDPIPNNEKKSNSPVKKVQKKTDIIKNTEISQPALRSFKKPIEDHQPRSLKDLPKTNNCAISEKSSRGSKQILHVMETIEKRRKVKNESI
ncbi:hypothetical protein TRFO_15937 [Tritrichomonas foetus]|uniref:Arf-GAP domain-containing protein n=1 Tax=Tritrichomonas foetus TaxID=1144522 RepID=A0A1J4KRB0_9EUKA|nr:hypothetical protein TRFO_15937 [Tritrichomonas foetus]|eukprot:OHT13817.1 hypothetical protein TRFO_15937 [Tritrichomonas foetus]